jgi:hypothetical protein
VKSHRRIHPLKKAFVFIVSLAFSYGIGFHPMQASLGPGHKDSSSGLQFTSRGHVMAFQPGGICVASGDHALRTTFVRCRNVQPRAEQPPQEKVSAPSLNRVIYPQLWARISLTYEAVEGGIVKSTFRLDPRARVEDIRLRYNAPLKVDKTGALHLAYAMGEMSESSPVAWQDINGRRLPVTASYRL